MTGKEMLPSAYDKTEEYKKNVAPLIASLVKECTKARIPLFISTAPKNDESETVYKNDGVLTGSLGITLKEDEFEKYLAVLHGGKVFFPGGEPDLAEGKLFEYIESAINNDSIHPEDDPEDIDNLEEVMNNEIK